MRWIGATGLRDDRLHSGGRSGTDSRQSVREGAGFDAVFCNSSLVASTSGQGTRYRYTNRTPKIGSVPDLAKNSGTGIFITMYGKVGMDYRDPEGLQTEADQVAKRKR